MVRSATPMIECACTTSGYTCADDAATRPGAGDELGKAAVHADAVHGLGVAGAGHLRGDHVARAELPGTCRVTCARYSRLISSDGRSSSCRLRAHVARHVDQMAAHVLGVHDVGGLHHARERTRRSVMLSA